MRLMKMRLTTALFLCCLMLRALAAQDHDEALKDYLTDDVVAVAYLDLSKLDTIGALEWATELGLGPTTEQRGQAMQMMLKVQERLDQAADFGARYVYVLVRVDDFAHGGPTWVLPVSEPGNPRAVLGMFLSGRPDHFEIERELRPKFLPDHCEVVGNAVVGANSAEQLAQIKRKPESGNRDITEVWKALGNGTCGLLVLGDSDSRRVVRELFPALPAPFHGVDGPLIADQLLWGGLTVTFPPSPKLTLLVETNEDSVATMLQQSAEMGLGILKILPIDPGLLTDEDRAALATALVPRVEGKRLVVSFDSLLEEIDRMAQLLKPRVQSARQAAQATQRTNNFRRIALAMLNYESSRGTYPPVGSYSADGKPLLSWRVHVLPYMGDEELALYKQFHLDEPWDSEHNKQLIPLMPDVYADPDSAIADRTAVGRTTVVVPTGPGTLFSGPEGKTVRDVVDGTSNTIMLAEIWTMAGPYWTRPQDWLFDPTIPWERLTRRDNRDSVTTAFCDGSVRMLPISTPDDQLRALVTIAGGEVVETP